MLDPDRVASAVTRPTRDIDVEKFEDELAQLGYVMSLDLAMTMRRLPSQAILELRAWISATLAMSLGARRPHVPLFRGFRMTAPGETSSLYLQRMLTWILTRPLQPCPWCGQLKPVGALDPCGHLVCRTCWDGGTFAGCPICHRRVAIGDPFARAATTTELVTHHHGELRLLHLGFDLVGAARDRFERLVGRASPLSPDDRAELELVIDVMGPKTVHWLPAQIPIKETMAIVLARLWMVAADRTAMVNATHGHLATATDVLRVAAVLLGGNPELVEPMRLGSVGRGLRRALLEALERLPAEHVIEHMWRRRGLWKRVGERLHPYEQARRLPVVTLAFAAVRQTRLDTATFGAAVRDEARGLETIRIAEHCARLTPWASHVEACLGAGDARAAAERLGERPGELLRRVDHLVRVAQVHQPDAIAALIGAVETASARGTPAALVSLVSHIAQRNQPWQRRVFFPNGDVRRAWSAPDLRAPLRGDAVGALVALLRAELVSRAAGRRNFARAVIDRGLIDLDAHGMRWLDVHRTGRDALHPGSQGSAPRAARSPFGPPGRPGRDFADLATTGARPTLWDLATIHAVARANIVYVRERGGAIAVHRRRDKEQSLARLARLHAGDGPDTLLGELPPANAPTWFALLHDDIELPKGSVGYVLDPRPPSPGVDRRSVGELLAELTR